MDIELAGQLNGIETATILAERIDIPVIFITGFSHDPLLEQAKRTAPYGYLIKPVNERDLAATITMALHRYALDQQLKESRSALAESESRYRLLFEKAPVGIFCTTLAGTILLANQEMATMLGWQSPQEAIAHYTDLARQVYVHPGVRAEFISRIQTDGEVRSFEFEGRKKNGEHIWVSMDARLSPADGMVDGSGAQVIDGFARDITARKRAEQALEESEQRHRSYLTNTPYGVFAVDAAGRFLQVNPSACRISGYAEHELLTMSLADLHFAADWPVVQPFFQRVLGGEFFQKDLPFRRKDGERRWYGLTAVKITETRFLAFCNQLRHH
jgi:PAS domain S-box-containing protein